MKLAIFLTVYSGIIIVTVAYVLMALYFVGR